MILGFFLDKQILLWYINCAIGSSQRAYRPTITLYMNETQAANPTKPTPATPPAVKKKKKSAIVAVVHPEGCTGCEVCIEFCPVDCLYKVPGPENPEEHGYVSVNGIVIVDEEVCIGCKLCAKYCPWDTIDMVKRVEEMGTAA